MSLPSSLPDPLDMVLPTEPLRSAVLIVVNPSGSRNRVALEPIPFLIGRQTDNHLVLRDNRASRSHARIDRQDGDYYVEDLESRHGVYVNGERVTRRRLLNGDRIEFGVADSYQLLFTLEEAELHRILDQFAAPPEAGPPGGSLAKLRALVEVARALESSLSTDGVLSAVVNAALTVTGAERGFLLLREQDELAVRIARDKTGAPLSSDELRVPTRLIHRALNQRRELLSMNFDPLEQDGVRPDMSVANLELRSVVCVPLVKVRAGAVQETALLSAASDTVGLIYLDSRIDRADLSSGNREILQTLALEASTILENARLLEQERIKRHMEEELNLAREVQASLLPRELPSSGWLRVAGSSLPSFRVSGDYFEVRPQSRDVWSVTVADVSGKGVGSALLAALLQGSFLFSAESGASMSQRLARVNHFLHERTGGEKYATLFSCTVDAGGRLVYVNAGHCAPLWVRAGGEIGSLLPTAMPVGLMESAEYPEDAVGLAPGDKIVIYSDGITEAMNAQGAFFGLKRLKETVRAWAAGSAAELHRGLMDAVASFTTGAMQNDDATLVVLEYQP